MARGLLYGNAINWGTFQALHRVPLFVYHYGTTTPATLYALDGVTPIRNPIVTNDFGLFGCVVEEGDYDFATPYTADLKVFSGFATGLATTNRGYFFANVIYNRDWTIAPYSEITVRDSTGALATIYDITGATQISNPILADEWGLAACTLPPGSYYVEVTDGRLSGVKTFDVVETTPVVDPSIWLRPTSSGSCTASSTSVASPELSADFYARVSSITQTPQWLYGNWGSSSPWAVYYINGDIESQVRYPPNTPVQVRFPVSDMLDGEWHRISIVNNSSGISIYLDGVLKDSQSYPNTGLYPGSGLDGMGLGCSSNVSSGDAVDFDLCDFRIWTKALAGQDLEDSIPYATIPPSDPDLLHYWQANEGSGTTVADQVGTNNAYVNNSAWWAP